MRKCKHGWRGWWTCSYADNTNLEILSHASGHELRVHWDNTRKINNNEFCLIGCPHNSSNRCQDKHVLLKWKDRHVFLTWNRTRELETAFVLCVFVHAGNPQFRFQHGPFTKRFRPVVTKVPAVVLSISRFSWLAVTRAWLFALNKLTTEGTGTYSHFGPRPLRMSWVVLRSLPVEIGLFHMARASSRLTSVQINTTKQFWLWGLAACLPPRRALTYAWNAHMCLHPPSVTVWIVIDCKRNLQQDRGYCTKKICRCTSFKSTRTLELGVHLFCLTWEDHLSSLFHSEEFD